MSDQTAAHNPSGAVHPTRFLLGWGIASVLLTYLVPLGLPLDPTLREVLAKSLVAPGTLILLWSQVTFWRAGTTTEHRQETTTLVTSGPFRLSRNPIYVALVLLMIGIGFQFDTVWAILLALPVAAALRQLTVLPEERYLERRFGDTYQTYRRRVRRWV